MKHNRILFIQIIVCTFASFAILCSPVKMYGQNNAPYNSEDQLTNPTLFADGIINTIGDEYGAAFMPDGKTLYFVKRIDRDNVEYIFTSHFENGKWSAPTIAEFSGYDFDKDPTISPGGKKLIFASKRSVDGISPSNDFHLWFMDKTTTGWSEPHVFKALNTNGNSNYPSIAANGNLYFASREENNKGNYSLYVSRFTDGNYSASKNMGNIFTSKFSDSDPYIAPDESYLIFSSTRDEGYGEGDLYISFNQNGVWSTPKNLGPKINTRKNDYAPLVSPDGKYFFFSRDWGTIYQIDFETVLKDLKTLGHNE